MIHKISRECIENFLTCSKLSSGVFFGTHDISASLNILTPRHLDNKMMCIDLKHLDTWTPRQPDDSVKIGVHVSRCRREIYDRITTVVGRRHIRSGILKFCRNLLS